MLIWEYAMPTQHQWLFLNSLDTVATVRRLVAFYVEQHNTCLPHSAFQGQTPEEMYFGTGANVPAQLEEARRGARTARLECNRATSCPSCQVQHTEHHDLVPALT